MLSRCFQDAFKTRSRCAPTRLFRHVEGLQLARGRARRSCAPPPRPAPCRRARKSSCTTSISRRNFLIMSNDSFTATSKSRPITSPLPSAAAIAEIAAEALPQTSPSGRRRDGHQPPDLGLDRLVAAVGGHAADRHVDQVVPLDRPLEARRSCAASRSGAPAAPAAPAAAARARPAARPRPRRSGRCRSRRRDARSPSRCARASRTESRARAGSAPAHPAARCARR